MAKRVKAARVEFYNPATNTLRYTLNDDILGATIEENSGDEADDARISIGNPGFVHTGQFLEGDEVRVYIRTVDDNDLVHIWTGTVDSVKHAPVSDSYGTIEVRAQDWVYYALAHTYVTDAFEDEYAGAIARTLIENENLGIDLTGVQDTAVVVPSLSFNGTSLLQVVRRLAELADADLRSDKDKKFYFYPTGTSSSGKAVTAAKVVRGSFEVESSMADFGNVIKIRGGSRSQLDKESTTFSTYATVTGATRKKARVYVSKSNVSIVEVYTNPSAGFDGDLRVRVQADNESGTAPIEEANADRDLGGRTLSKEFLTAGGFTSFLLPSNIVAPGSYVWLILECATTGESQQVGVNASGDPLYKTYYPVPIITERTDDASVALYGRRELPPLNDKNIATDAEAELIADAMLAIRATPAKQARYEVHDFDLATAQAGQTLTITHANAGISSPTTFTLHRVRHEYDSQEQLYRLTHEASQ